MGSIGSRLIAQTMVLAVAGSMANAASSDCAADRVDLRGPSGQQRFHVEVADDPAEQAQGLMFRQKMALSAGMLFVFPQPKHAQFWMKNTLIPLDMIFVDPSGRVTKVHPNAVPQDQTVIDGGEGVAFVLEINGGLAARMGIAEGAELRHPAIGAPVWPCDAP